MRGYILNLLLTRLLTNKCILLIVEKSPGFIIDLRYMAFMGGDYFNESD
jgi:hypothetical protein